MKTQETKHTSGPWYLVSTDNDHAHLQSTTRETDNYIGLLDIMDAEQDANARLIVAAPELLEALEKLQWLIEAYDLYSQSQVSSCFSIDDKTRRQQAISAAQAAIAKAGGAR